MHIVKTNGEGRIITFFGTDFNNVQSDLHIVTFPSFFLTYLLQPCSSQEGG